LSNITFQLRRYRDERGRGDGREGGELHDILFGGSPQDNVGSPSSPYYDGSSEVRRPVSSFRGIDATFESVATD
jgi:hypothetical protein